MNTKLKRLLAGVGIALLVLTVGYSFAPHSPALGRGTVKPSNQKNAQA